MTTIADFERDYLEALRSVMNGDEDKANHALSALKPKMATLKPTDVVSERFTRMVKDLRETGIDNLSGDFKSTSRTPWIKDRGLLSMISRHVGYLGTHNDAVLFKDFEHRTETFFQRLETNRNAPKVVNG